MRESWIMRAPCVRRVTAGLISLLLMVSVLPAAFTSPDVPALGEPTIDTPGGLLDRLYGLGNLERVDDREAMVTDQMWQAMPGSEQLRIMIMARYAPYGLDLGLIVDEDPVANFQAIADAGGKPRGIYPRSIATSVAFETAILDSAFRWGIFVSESERVWSSREIDNVSPVALAEDGDGDRMLTFQIVDNENAPSNAIGSYVIVWEDSPTDLGMDRDFNDLVVEVSGAQPIPEPLSLSLLAGGLLWVRRRARG